MTDASNSGLAVSDLKKTEIGFIPKDWDAKALGELCEFENGDRSSNYPSGNDFSYSGIPFVNAGHVANGRIDFNRMDFITDESYSRLTRGKVRSGDIVYCLRGSLGKYGLVPEGFGQGAIASSLVIVRSKPLKLTREYLACYFGSSLCAKMIENWASGAAQPNLGVQDLARFLMPLPTSTDEQQSIATALSDTDALIDSLEQLLTKKRQIKQGAMQELLTGKRRLPGFAQPWQASKVGQLGIFLKGSGIKRGEALSGDLPCVRYGEIYTKHSDIIRNYSSWISPDVASSATLLRQGDLLFAGSGETKEDIGKCVAFLDDMPAYAGGDIVILRPTVEADSVFLGYLLNMPSVTLQKASRGQGDAVVHISAKAIGEIEVKLPEPSEQVAIAQVLLDMDSELTKIESRLTKARALKQAMAHALLTGRIRLVEPTA